MIFPRVTPKENAEENGWIIDPHFIGAVQAAIGEAFEDEAFPPSWESIEACLLAAETLSHQPLTFRQLQEEQAPWVAHNFPGREAYYPLLGAIEELGELAHAHLKNIQGIRGTPEEHHAAKIDAVADTVTFLADYCTASGIDFQEAMETTWAKVKTRDWKNDPANGTAKPIIPPAPPEGEKP